MFLLEAPTKLKSLGTSQGVMQGIWLCLVALLLLMGPGAAQFDFEKKQEDPNAPKPQDPEFQSTGVLLLDDLLFDKIVPGARVDVVVMILNKANIGKRTTDFMREEYMAMAKKTKQNDDVLFTQILLNGSENKKLAMRVGIENQPEGHETKPEFFLFRVGEKNAIPIKPDEEDFTVADVMAFISKTTGVQFTFRGTIKEFSELAAKFVASETGSKARTDIYHEAKQKADAYASDESKKKTAKERSANAGWYVQAMEKILEKGNEWPKAEISRLSAIIVSDKVSDSRKDEFKRRLNIVQVFKEIPELVSYKIDKQKDGDAPALE